METMTVGSQTVVFQWASDIAFDGIRLEILSDDSDVVFDVSIPEDGPMTVNTFGKEVAVDLIKVAIETAERRQ
ncbi:MULTISPECIES: hypothetical protein [unclassified Novosphingobium]|uniref:hypothetical protein n=1 Tax=unclassified Novosphingobium TaxID=2644732 RepID=UPI0013596480|nr:MULTISPECIES: hypothetical protein [unclassified Novosphingobium]